MRPECFGLVIAYRIEMTPGSFTPHPRTRHRGAVRVRCRARPECVPLGSLPLALICQGIRQSQASLLRRRSQQPGEGPALGIRNVHPQEHWERGGTDRLSSGSNAGVPCDEAMIPAELEEFTDT